MEIATTNGMTPRIESGMWQMLPKDYEAEDMWEQLCSNPNWKGQESSKCHFGSIESIKMNAFSTSNSTSFACLTGSEEYGEKSNCFKVNRQINSIVSNCCVVNIKQYPDKT